MTDTTESPAGAPWLDHDRRLTRLETLYESLATKADLERVRGELGSEIQKGIVKMMSVQIVGLIAIGGMVFAMLRLMDAS